MYANYSDYKKDITPAFMLRAFRDEIYEKAGIFPGRSQNGLSHFVDQRGFGVNASANGSMAYVMWGRRANWKPQTYLNADGKVLWLRTDELQEFADTVLPKIQQRFVLVTTEADFSPILTCRDGTEKILASDKVAHWFCAQSDISASVVKHTPIPLGIPYPYRHDLSAPLLPLSAQTPRYYDIPGFDSDLNKVLSHRKPLGERKIAAFGDFGLNNSSKASPWGETRADIRSKLEPTGLVEFPSTSLPRFALYRTYCDYAFVASPFGRGLDCYRTWEAILMGAIPIVKTSALDPVFDGFPVAIVEDWREITKSKLENWLVHFSALAGSKSVEDRLLHSYWQNQIRAAAMEVT
jgi:hypothetical protein